MNFAARQRVPVTGRRSKTLGSLGAGVRFALLSGLLLPAGALRAGISLHVPVFSVDNLLLGRVYIASRDILGSPLTLTNGTETPLKCSLHFYVPGKDQLREGAEPIPDASWVTPARDSFALPPGKDGGADFYVSIPNDKSLLGRKFQVQFVAQTSGEGQFVQLGMGGRAFLTVLNKSVEWSAQEKKDKMFGVRFRTDPLALRSNDVPLGRRMPFKKLAGTRWLVRNDGDYPAKVSVRVATYEETETVLPPGYEAGPDPEKVQKLSKESP